ncbi:MAG: divergent polysaccharide deacetylase family protein [Spirochaetales bacterium]|nr:divergent polysaccharide deacetylase family protein [Spirochaetales bacterium]
MKKNNSGVNNTVKKRRQTKKSMMKERSIRAVVMLFIIFFLLTIILCFIPEKPGNDIAETEGNGEAPVPERTGGPARREEPEVFLSIVIDDAGYSLSELTNFLDFPAPLSIAVLPQLPESRESARRILDAGKEVLLHQPMEPLGHEDPGPGAIYTTSTANEIESILEKNLSSVPGAAGANNHMGSKATADEHLMDVVLAFFKKKGMYFLDSKTTPYSVAEQSASLYDVPFFERHIFLDYETDDDIIRTQMKKGLELAVRTGYAVLIGHIRNTVIIDILGEYMPVFREKNVRLVTLSELKQTVHYGRNNGIH